MSNFLLDTFTDTAGTLLDSHIPDAGGPATKIPGLTGSAQITAAGRLRSATAAVVVGYQYAGSPGATDYDVSADVFLASSTVDSLAAGPMARAQGGAQTCYWGRLAINAGVPGYDLYKCIAGTFTRLASLNAPLTVGSTTRLKLSLRGSSITLYTSADGGNTFTAVCSASDTSITSPGLAGVGFYQDAAPSDSVGAHVDNLSGTSLISIAPNNPAWFSSPGNWIVSPASAISADFGAKRSIVVSGTPSATLSFDMSALTTAAVAPTDYPQIRYSIDAGPTLDAPLAASVGLFAGLATSSHEIVYEFVRGNFNTDAWITPVMAIRETALILAVGATVSSPTDLQTDRMFVAGDSITAGLAMLSNAIPAGGDAAATFAKALGPALGAEVGISGKGGVGWAYAGSANVPAFTTEWKNAWTAQPRSFPALKRLLAVMGTNDALNNITDAVVTSAVTAWLADARSTLGPATWIHLVVPFGGFKRSALTAALASYLASHPGDKSDLIDLGPLLQIGLAGPYGSPTRPAPFDGIHPNTITHGQLAAALATAIRAAETPSAIPSTTRTSNNVGGGIFAGL